MEVYPVPVFSPPDLCDGERRCRDMWMEFVYIVVIPAGVVLLLAMVLSMILCCSCTRRRKKSESQEDIDLDKYNSIRRASQGLRELSRKRDTLLLSSRSGSMTLDREHRYRRGMHGRDTCQSAPGTLQRDRRRERREAHSASPPPYQLPPQYSVNSGEAIDRSSATPHSHTASENDALMSQQYA
ncbi:uncharacterized protein LOC110462346 [Mizuhopecten yessoensis]|uniref:Epsilon-sarcoglycan n=1 Tax=Mizuhopecten yessoensis TaxID=6573 RepID=A0A210PYG3_MIZYE|nr:uncharacterized protein LOC110462346 [Mizuhopecten yessoensis]XP_021371961.1 uncharacterized protein LOC110462346 [Mizuhopecten yessoensis]OWF41513.1 Epsilon-sarcoglycan [Mizuhopecten yessoensis]